jgi:hypothetical protein
VAELPGVALQEEIVPLDVGSLDVGSLDVAASGIELQAEVESSGPEFSGMELQKDVVPSEVKFFGLELQEDIVQFDEEIDLNGADLHMPEPALGEEHQAPVDSQ